MAMVNKNSYGIIGINNSVITKMIVSRLLKYDDYLIPCNKKGKPINRNIMNGFSNDYQNSVEVKEFNERLYITVYIISKFGESMSNISEMLFADIQKDLAMVGVPQPKEIKITIKGVMSKQIAERNIDLVKVND